MIRDVLFHMRGVGCIWDALTGARLPIHHNKRLQVRSEDPNNSSRKQTSISLWSRASGSRLSTWITWITGTTGYLVARDCSTIQHGTARPSLPLAQVIVLTALPGLPRKVTRASPGAYQRSSTCRDASDTRSRPSTVTSGKTLARWLCREDAMRQR